MSVVRIAARMAIIEALRDQTLFGANVHDSLIGGIEADADGNLNIGDGEKRPVITVYTDAAKQPGALRSLIENSDTEIVIEWGVSAGMHETDPETGVNYVVAGMPSTDAAFEFSLDMVGHQIGRALSNPDSVYAQIWMNIASGGFSKVELLRSSNDRDGARVAAHQLRITASLMNDPIAGEEMPEPLPELIALLKASEKSDIVAAANMIEAVTTGENEPWESVQRRFGMSNKEAHEVGIRPEVFNEDSSTPTFEEGVAPVVELGS